jgi:hypothetical protein
MTESKIISARDFNLMIKKASFCMSYYKPERARLQTPMGYEIIA